MDQTESFFEIFPAGAVGAAVAAHAAVSILKRASDKNEPAKADH